MKRTVSLRENYEFQRAYRKGAFKVGRWISVYAVRNHKETLRLGISVGKKAGNSVQRSRFTRLIRESYRLLEDSVKDGYDIVVAARPLPREAPSKNRRVKATVLPEYRDVSEELSRILKRLDLIKGSEDR